MRTSGSLKTAMGQSLCNGCYGRNNHCIHPAKDAEVNSGTVSIGFMIDKQAHGYCF
ncbi:MAG TPA: hypothetical protein VIM07_08080 [Chitinophagaceae bacterium]